MRVHSYRVPTISSNLGFDLLNYNIAITLYEKNQDVLYFIKMYMATIKLSLLKESVSLRRLESHVIWLSNEITHKWHHAYFIWKTLLKQCRIKINTFSTHPKIGIHTHACTHTHTMSKFTTIKLQRGRFKRFEELDSIGKLLSQGSKNYLLHQTKKEKKNPKTLQFYDPKLQISFILPQDVISEPYKQKNYWSGIHLNKCKY